MHLQINGETHEYSEALPVSQLLETLGFDVRKVGLERNLELVPRSRYADVALAEGDKIEIVRLIES